MNNVQSAKTKNWGGNLVSRLVCLCRRENANRIMPSAEQAKFMSETGHVHDEQECTSGVNVQAHMCVLFHNCKLLLTRVILVWFLVQSHFALLLVEKFNPVTDQWIDL